MRYRSLYIFLLIVAIGSTLMRQYQLYLTVAPTPLFPDVNSYREIALRLHGFYETATREPILIWILKVGMAVFGTSDTVLRCMGVVAYWIFITFFFLTIRKITQRPWLSLLCLFILLRSYSLLEFSVHGVRDNYFLMALAIFAYALASQNLRGLTVGAILILGTRVTSLPLLFLVLAIYAWKSSRPKWEVLFPALVPLAILAPYFAYCQRFYGDPFYAANFHAIWWRNYEFYGVLRPHQALCPLPPTLSGMYDGPKTTWVSYIFGCHEFSYVLKRVVEGFLKLFILPGGHLKTLSGCTRPYIYPFYYLGIVLVAKSRYWYLLLVPPLLLNLLLFTVHLEMDPRLFTPAIPFMVSFTAVGVWTTLCIVYNKVSVLLNKKPKGSLIEDHTY